MTGAVDTLFLPHKTALLPTLQAPWLFLGADLPQGGFADDMKANLVCEQGWRDKYLSLVAAGLKVEPVVNAERNFDGAFVLLTKHKRENKDMIAKAMTCVKAGCPILVAGDKNLGISSIKKWVSSAIPIVDSIAKYHSTVFWFSADSHISLPDDVAQVSPEGFITSPGMFSPEKVDQGSSLLSEHLTHEIKGDVADFGAGWGFISKKILTKCRSDSLDLFEVHFPSLQASKTNLAMFDSKNVSFHWHDLTNEPVTRKYDHIIMNPPFHTGRKTEPSLGEKFIEVASAALRPRGRLLMVANSNLPYEASIRTYFGSSENLQSRDGFKVLQAIR